MLAGCGDACPWLRPILQCLFFGRSPNAFAHRDLELIDDDGGLDSGSIFVHSGADGSLLFSIAETQPGGSLGFDVDSAGDVTGDGLADIVSGSPTGPGTLWLYSGRDGSLLFSLQGLDQQDAFGKSVAGLGDVNGDGFSDIAVGAKGGGAGDNGSLDVLSGTCMPPAPFCTAAANSTGGPALMGHAGTLRFADNDFSLTVSGAVPQQFGVFFYGPDATDAPFGNGTLCVGGGAAGIFRLNPPVAIDGSGSAERALDFTLPPLSAGPGAVTPLSTWRFQFWYRDPQAGGSFFNLSDGLDAYFCPGG